MGQLIIAGLVLGGLSGFHCVGMCGPIALSLPVHHLPPKNRITGIVLYHSGRIMLYALLGVLFGMLGRQFYLGGVQQLFSFFLGILVLLMLVKRIWLPNLLQNQWLDKPTYWLQQFMMRQMKQNSRQSFFLLGAANGLLPCGMVYLALTGAMAAGNIGGAVLFMTAFGAGTLPLLFSLSFFGFLLGPRTRNNLRKTVPYVMLLMGILLILRGLNLNIPYISPLLPRGANTTISCT